MAKVRCARGPIHCWKAETKKRRDVPVVAMVLCRIKPQAGQQLVKRIAAQQRGIHRHAGLAGRGKRLIEARVERSVEHITVG